MTPASLIERVEKLTGPDREVDLAIARELVPDVIVLRHDKETGENRPYTYWEYTGSIDAAIALVERVRPGSDIRIERSDDLWTAAIGWPHFGSDGTGSGANGAIALILALLRSLQGTET